MSAQGPGRKRIPNRDKLSAEDDALNEIVREAEARLAAKRAARAEARDIRMKELEKREKELFHSHKRYYGLDNKWGHIEQWMEDSERYSRHSRRLTSVSDDEEKMSVGSRGSFRPSDYSSFLSSSSRASSRASSARASPVVEERPDRDFLDKGSRTASTLSAATLASLGGAASRRGSCDTSLSVETEASIREMKDSLVEAEEKYRKAMVSNAQLHNEKTALMYQVETLREELNDIEELLWEARRQCDMTTKEFERERQAHVFLQFHFKEMKETMRQSDELLTEVSELRVRSRTHCQEVCDLQETLQWKDKRIVALERQKEISDVVCIQRDQLRNEVRQLRDLLKKHGIVLPDITPNGESEKCMAEDDITDEPGSRLAQETSHGGRENILGKAPTQHPADDAKYETKGATRRIFKHSQSVNEITSSGRERWSADSQNQEEHGRPSRDETDDENKINKMMTQMSLDVFNEEKNEDCEGQSPEVGDLSKGNMEKSAGFLSPQSPSKDKDFTFSYSDVCDEPKSSEHNPCLPVEGNTVRERRSLRKEVKNQMIPLVHKTNPNVSFENLNQPPRSSVSPFVHKEAMKDWTGVETMIQSILRWILQNQSFVEELKASLNWILEGEDVEKNTEAKVLDPADQIKPLADGGQTGSVSAVMDELVSADASGSGSRAKTILHLKKRDDRGAAGRTSVVTLRTPASNQQETLVENEDDQSNDDHDLTTCCCQDFVFVELYFAEPFESRAEDCGSDQDSVDLEVKPDKPAGGLKKEKTKCYLHHRSNVRSFSEEETVVKRVETVTKDTDQVFPVKNRKMKNNCVIL